MHLADSLRTSEKQKRTHTTLVKVLIHKCSHIYVNRYILFIFKNLICEQKLFYAFVNSLQWGYIIQVALIKSGIYTIF